MNPYLWLSSLVDYKNSSYLILDIDFLSLFDNGDGSDSGQDDIGSGEGSPDSNPYPDPGNNNRDDKGSGEGKGKAKAITPEYITEEPKESYTDLEEYFQDDLKKAKLESLKEINQGESSKQGANLEHLDEQNKLRDLSEYHNTIRARKEAVRTFNDILDKIEKEGDSLSQKDKEYLLNESIKLKNAVNHYANHAQSLKNEMNIHSSEEECSSEENSSEDNWSEDSSSEESRPFKRPRN